MRKVLKHSVITTMQSNKSAFTVTQTFISRFASYDNSSVPFFCRTPSSCLMRFLSFSRSLLPLSASSWWRLEMSCLISFTSPVQQWEISQRYPIYHILITRNDYPDSLFNSPSLTWPLSLSLCDFRMYLLMRRLIIFCQEKQKKTKVYIVL